MNKKTSQSEVDVTKHEQMARMVTGENEPGDINLRCPYCDDDYTHIERVFQIAGCDHYESEAIIKGVEVLDVGKERRAALGIVFSCENLHRWKLVIQQHKGTNWLCLSRLKNLIGINDDDYYFG